MRAVMVKVVAPRRDQIASMAQVVEQVFVQTLILHPAVEAFHKPFCIGLPGAM